MLNRTITAPALAVSAVLSAVGLTGCTPSNSGSPGDGSSVTARTAAPTGTPSASTPTPPDYSRLVITPGDIDTADTFTARPPTANPDGLRGVMVLFTSQDDVRAIGDTVLVFPDAAAATTALRGVLAFIGDFVTGGSPEPLTVGTEGTVVSGASPVGSKAVTVVVFTEDRALVRLEFDSVLDDPMARPFVTDVAQKQDIAVRAGLVN
jgi:hypothetical protein